MEQRAQNRSFSEPGWPVRPCHRDDFSGFGALRPMGISGSMTVDVVGLDVVDVGEECSVDVIGVETDESSVVGKGNVDACSTAVCGVLNLLEYTSIELYLGLGFNLSE